MSLGCEYYVKSESPLKHTQSILKVSVFYFNEGTPTVLRTVSLSTHIGSFLSERWMNLSWPRALEADCGVWVVMLGTLPRARTWTLCGLRAQKLGWPQGTKSTIKVYSAKGSNSVFHLNLKKQSGRSMCCLFKRCWTARETCTWDCEVTEGSGAWKNVSLSAGERRNWTQMEKDSWWQHSQQC